MLSNIRGTEDSIPFNARIVLPAGIYTNFNLRSYILGTTRWNGIKRLNCDFTIAGGAVIGSYTPYMPAMIIGGFTSRDIITVRNNGAIQGAGGDPNMGGSYGGGGGGGAGGTALYTNNNINLYNAGSIWSGGGGGGGGAGYRSNIPYDCSYSVHDCNGGDTGCLNNGGSNTRDGCPCWCCYKCKSRRCAGSRRYTVSRTCYNTSIVDAGGAGGRGQGFNNGQTIWLSTPTYGGYGGRGGTWGSAGNQGRRSSVDYNSVPDTGGPGGPPGWSIFGRSLVNIVVGGSIAGPTTG